MKSSSSSVDPSKEGDETHMVVGEGALGDPMGNAHFDKDFLIRETFDGDKQENKLIDIESRKDKDAFFDSLAGWNADDKLGRKQQAFERKLRKKEEKEARMALRKQRQSALQDKKPELQKLATQENLPTNAELG